MNTLLLKNIFCLVPMDEERHRYKGMDILIRGNEISQIGKNLDTDNAEIIDCSTKLVIPGLINTHHHLFQTFQRNIPAAQNAPLFQWLTTLYEVWKYMNEDVVHYSTLLGCAELLKTGCTTTSDNHYLYPKSFKSDIPEIQMEAAGTIGIRFAPTRGSMSRGKSKGGLPPDVVVQDEEDILIQSEEAIKRFHDPSPLSMRQIHLSPCSPFNVTAELMKETATLARKYRVRLHTHLCETKDEEVYCLETYGMRPLAFMESVDWLGEDVWYAHGIHFNDEELALLAQTRTGIAHCPSSNMRLGSGIARVPEMRQMDIPVGLAVDGSASNDTSDMVGEMRTAMLLHRVNSGADAMGAEDALELATIGSAKLLGRTDIGSIEVGKAADLALFEMDALEYTGALSDPLAALIFTGISHQVDTTIVNGKVVVRDGHLLNVDEREIIDNGNRLSKMMLHKAGML